MVEDTYYSDVAALDVPMLRARIDEYAKGAGEVIGEETGVLPVALGGSIEGLWTGGAALLGLRGGFFHPTTGYSLPDAVANALRMTEQRDFSGAALFGLYRDRARTLWRERAFFRLLNRMMFRAAAPAQRYRVLEHFYRLPEPVIARFYAAKLTRLDKVRILTGKPPVPVLKALKAMAA
jgi:lycopene beta-cyclase